MSKVFTLAEVSEHNSKKDCWLVMFGKYGGFTAIWWILRVYDVTKFLDDHPGGDEVLLTSTGKDATEDFEDVGHSTAARAMLDEYYVGDIDSATVSTKTTTATAPPKPPKLNQDSPSFIIKLLQFLVPLLILGVAFGVRFYTKSPA